MADQTNLAIRITAKDEASAALKSVSKTISDNFGKIQLAAAAASAAITAFGLASLSSFASTGEELSNMAVRTGIATEELSALKLASDQTSVSMGSIETAVKKMQLNLESMNKAGTEAQSVVTNLGIDFEELSAKSPEAQLFELGNAIADIQDPAKRTTAAMELFGKSGTELLPLFQDGAMSMEDWTKKAKDLGLVFDKDLIDKAGKVDQAFDDMKAGFDGLKTQVAAALSPAMVELSEKFTEVLPKVTQWIQKNPQLASGILLITQGLTAFLAIAPGVAAALGLIGSTLGFIAANPITLVIAGIAALIAAFVACVAFNEEFRTKVLAVWVVIRDAVTSTVQAIYDTVVLLFTSMIDTVKAILEAFRLAWEVLWGGLTAVFTVFKDGVIGAFSLIQNAVIIALDVMKTTVEGILNALKATWDLVWGAMGDTVTNVVDGIISAVEKMANVIGGALNQVKEFTKTGGAVTALTGGAAGGSKQSPKKKARGGALGSGEMSWVGEEGPELFVPSSRGMVIPSTKSGGGESIQVVITGNSFLDERSAEKMGDLIFGKLRLNSRIA